MIKHNLSIYCLKYAQSVLPENAVICGGEENKFLPISFAIYLIRVGSKNILIDAGCDNMPGFVMRRFYSPAFVLREVGISADEITDVIITHAHHDHVEAVKHFNNAVIHISRAEYEDGKKFMFNNTNVNIFENEYTINSQVKIIEYSGHSKGSAIVEVRTDGLIHIFAGDECYTNANIENKIRTGASINGERSYKFVEKYSSKKYCVHTCHDISLKTERII